MNHKNFNTDKLFWGLLFLFCALALIFNKLGFWPVVADISFIGLLFTIIFVWMLYHGIRRINFFEILFSLAFLGIIYDDFLGITALTPWTLLAAALFGSIGLTIIFHPNHHPIGGIHYHSTGSSKVFNEEDGECIHFENSFSSSIKYINTEALVNASLESSFGEMKVYFDNAVIKNGVADVNIEVSFGNMVLYIPRTWNVENHVETTFGALKENNSNCTPGCPTLRLFGSVAFGAAEIIYI